MSAATSTLRVRATDLRLGDVITEPGCIALTVVGIRRFDAHSLVAIDYTCFGGSASDARALVSGQIVTVIRPVAEEVH